MFLEAPGFRNRTCDEVLSKLAFVFNLRRYILEILQWAREHGAPWDWEIWPDTICSPRHRMLFNSTNEASINVSITWRTSFVRPCWETCSHAAQGGHLVRRCRLKPVQTRIERQLVSYIRRPPMHLYVLTLRHGKDPLCTIQRLKPICDIHCFQTLLPFSS